MSATWIWLIAGVLLLIVELSTGTLTFLFFALSAFIVAGLRLAGVDGWVQEGLAFAFFAFAGLLLFRRKLKEALASRSSDFKNDVDRVLTLETAIPPQGEAQVSYQGSHWTAFNNSSRTLNAGERVAIARTEGIKLILEPLKESA